MSQQVLRSNGVQIWQTRLAGLVRSGLYQKATVNKLGDLFVIQGLYPNGSYGSVVAKYQSEARADDAAVVVNRLAVLDPSVN